MKSFGEMLNEIALSGSQEEKMYRETGIEFCVALKKLIDSELSLDSSHIFFSTIEEIVQHKRISSETFEGHADYVTVAEVIGEVVHSLRGRISTKEFGI